MIRLNAIRLLSAVFAVSVGAVLPIGAAEEAPADLSPPGIEVEFLQPLETIPFVIPEGFFERYRDRERVKEILDFRGPKKLAGVGPDQVEGLSEEAFSALAAELAVAEILWATAVEEGFPEKAPALLRQLRRVEARLPSFIYYKQTVLDRVGEPSEADLQALYETHADVLQGEKKWTFGEARPHLISRWKADRREQIDADEVLRLLEAYDDRVTIHAGLIRAGEVPPYAVVLEVGDLRVAGKDLAGMGEEFRTSLGTEEDLKRTLARLRSVGSEMRRIAAEEEAIAETREFADGIREVKIDLIAGAYIGDLARRMIVVREAGLRALYQRSRERFRVPEQVDLYVIAKKIATAPGELPEGGMDDRVHQLKTELRELTREVASLAEFKVLAGELSDDPRTRANGGAMGLVPVSFRDGFDGLLSSLESGEASVPVRVDDTVCVFFAAGRKAAFYKQYEEVKEAVANQYQVLGTNRLYERLLEFLPEKFGF